MMKLEKPKLNKLISFLNQVPGQPHEPKFKELFARA